MPSPVQIVKPPSVWKIEWNDQIVRIPWDDCIEVGDSLVILGDYLLFQSDDDSYQNMIDFEHSNPVLVTAPNDAVYQCQFVGSTVRFPNVRQGAAQCITLLRIGVGKGPGSFEYQFG